MGVSLVIATVSLGVTSIALLRKCGESYNADENELSPKAMSSNSIQEFKIFEDQPYIFSKRSDGFDKIYFKPEKKFIIKEGVTHCPFVDSKEEYSIVKFIPFKSQGLVSAREKPEFTEFWLNKSEDLRPKELVSKEDAYKGRQSIKIETFLYILGSNTRMKYQEKSFWLSNRGITITPKACDPEENSKRQTLHSGNNCGRIRA